MRYIYTASHKNAVQYIRGKINGVYSALASLNRKEIMTEEVYYHSKSKGEDIPVSEMSDLYVRRAFKKMIMKERKRNDDKEKIKVNITNALMYLEKALEE